MENISKKMSEEWRKETLEELAIIFESIDEFDSDIQKIVKNGIKESTKIYGHLDSDSLLLDEFAEAVSEKFNTYISAEKVTRLKTFGDYIDYLAKEECINRR